MKTIKLVIAIIFVIYASVPFSFAAEAYPKDTSPGKNNLISLDLQDANLKTVLKMFSQQSGLNFIAGQSVQDRTVTVYFDNVKTEDALNYIMNANNLAYEQEPGTNIFIVKETGKPEIETITKIYELKYAQLSAPARAAAGYSGDEEAPSQTGGEIISIVQSLLSKDGKVIADKRSNSLIIRDVPSQFSIIENLLTRIDIRTPQVMIKVEVLETTAKLIENLGINWGDGSFGIYTGPIHNTIFPFNNRLGRNNSSGEGIAADGAGTFALDATTAQIVALKNSSDTKVLARPQIMTMNNELAKIELTGKEIARQVTSTTAVGSSGATTGTTYEEKDTGVILEVTPQISKDGYITMNLKPSVTDLENSRYTDQFDTIKRATETTVMIKDGETIIIGGLIRSRRTHGLKKVPFFGDIPVIGSAFRYKTKDDLDRELVIFITPRIMKDTPAYALGGISEREQEKPKAVREKEVNSILDLFGG
ncbi:MAG: secretin N-terminal domain-containing protein [Candidatus Omnitrophota bacterium]|jgi:type IV pilus secretin PilQ/predicted competence protein